MVNDLSTKVGTKKACYGFGIPRSSYYYWKNPAAKPVLYKKRELPDFAYTLVERKEILNVMNSDIYMNQYALDISSEGLENVRNFISNGRGYIGICGVAYFTGEC
jgi:hypothetical protein